MESLCGTDCSRCSMSSDCKGCAETGGRPFGSECVAANCCRGGADSLQKFKEQLMAAFNALGIPDMEPVAELHALKGSFANLAYTLPGGQTAQFWDDNKIYFGNQIHKAGSHRCYGILADETHLMVSEYGDGGSDAEVVLFKRWR